MDFVVLVLSATVLVLVLERIVMYEYRDAEYEYEKTHEQSIGPKCSIGPL